MIDLDSLEGTGETVEVRFPEVWFKGEVCTIVEERWMKKFHDLPVSIQESIFQRILDKYESDEYRIRCSKGIKNQRYLLSLLPDYLNIYENYFRIYYCDSAEIFTNKYLIIISFFEDPLMPLHCYFGTRFFTV